MIAVSIRSAIVNLSYRGKQKGAGNNRYCTTKDGGQQFALPHDQASSRPNNKKNDRASSEEFHPNLRYRGNGTSLSLSSDELSLLKVMMGVDEV